MAKLLYGYTVIATGPFKILSVFSSGFETLETFETFLFIFVA
jgi:hypothetical protein